MNDIETLKKDFDNIEIPDHLDVSIKSGIKKGRRNKRNNFLILVFIVIGVSVPLSGWAYTNQKGRLTKHLGEQVKIVKSSTTDETIVRVNGNNISKRAFEVYKLLLNETGTGKSDDEILDKLIEREVAYQDALNNGVIVKDETVLDIIKRNKDAFVSESNKEKYEEFKEYLMGLGMSEELYWESSIPAYKRALAIGTIKNKLKKQFMENSNLTDPKEKLRQFDEYYNKYLQKLKSSAEIEYEGK